MFGARGTGRPSNFLLTSPDFSSEDVRLLAACFVLLALGAGDLERERDLERDSFFVFAAAVFAPFPSASLPPLLESVFELEELCFWSTENGWRGERERA